MAVGQRKAVAHTKRMPEAARRGQILEAAFEVARRDGIGRLTVRSVAEAAAVSHGLVLFHFGRKDRLLHELLDWVIEQTAVLHVSEDIARFPHARDRLHALLEQEMARLSHKPEHTRIFLEYWAMGTRHPEIGARISAELERYRTAFRDIMEELLQAEPVTFPGTTADGLAAVAVSWIHGCAVQAMIDPEHVDTEEFLSSIRAMVDRFA